MADTDMALRNFHIEEEEIDGLTSALKLIGDVDLYVAADLRESVAQLIDRGKSRLVIDLTETTFIDSTTLGILVGAMRRLRTRGGRLTVVCPNPAISRVFEITGLDRMFGVYDTREEALAAPAPNPENAA
ncbi:MAG: STAS domain-containing protein [Thermoleophilaceae bacterium]